MRKDFLKKSVVLGIVMLFVGASIVPSISGDYNKTDDNSQKNHLPTYPHSKSQPMDISNLYPSNRSASKERHILNNNEIPISPSNTHRDIFSVGEGTHRNHNKARDIPNDADKYSLDELCGLVEPENWWIDAKFDLCTPIGDLPDTFDWRDIDGVDYTTPIKSQDGCGSCWAFGTVAPLECNIKIKDKVEVDLSEQWLVSCNQDGWGCSGGWWAHDYHQWKTDCCGETGAVLEEDFPYVGYDTSCDCPYSHPYAISSWAYVGNSIGIPSVNAIKQAIMDYGPVSAAVSVNSAFARYDGGIFNNSSDGSINHAVALVGWNDSQGTDGVWFLRNSWGTNWGENGYMRIEYGCSSVGYASCYVDYKGDKPNENATVCGYVNDSVTDIPIQNAIVNVYWWDEQNHKYGNSTTTISSGFYSMNVSASEIHLDVNAVGYFRPDTYTYNVEDNEVLWLDIPMYPYPPENSIICGYITDEDSGDAIGDAWVSLDWYDNQGHYYWNYTSTDSSGFYSMNVAAGEIDLYISKDGYCPDYNYYYYISDGELLWANISLYPRPAEDSVVHGYVTNELTSEPIENADVDLYWSDNQGHYYWNYTSTDSSGFYSMNVAAGDVKLWIDADGYFSNYWTDWYTIGENETLWVNISLEPRPPENSVVCGYVTDELTNKSIQDVYVDLDWYDNQGHYYWNYTSTDSSGFYSMNVAAGEIDLYISKDGYCPDYNYYYYYISDGELLWANISLYPRPAEDSVVHGYVTNELTSEPIENADVDLYWSDNQGHYYWNYTSTDSSGFYSMNVAAGDVKLWIDADGYFSNYWTDWYTIGENETLWVNISLEPRPPENSVVCGYVTDELTNKSIQDVYVDLDWHDDQEHHDWNDTYTDSSGFYSMNVAMGKINLYASKEGYFSNYTEDYNIGEYETLWVNVSLYPRPPENSIVCGYVTDELTNEPIENADVNLYWNYNQGHHYWNDTYTNDSGFYSMNVAAGEIQLSISMEEYIWNFTDWLVIGENEKLWLNFTLEKDVIPPNISNLTLPDYVGVNHPGDISVNISDNNLFGVYMLISDEYNITDHDFVIWYYLDYTGVNSTYAIKNYHGTYANLEQNTSSSPATVVTLSNSNETGKIYIIANFKKNHTSPWTESILLEFNRSNGILTNIAILTMSQNRTLELDYITDMVEPGVSIVSPISLYFSGPSVLGNNYTLYSIGNYSNPYLNWSLLGDGEYRVFVMADDKAYNQNSISANLTVGHKPIADFIYVPSNPTIKDDIQFTDTSTDDETIVSWLWDFGDGTTSTDQNPIHSYAVVGTYTVTLTVIDDDGASDNTSAEITIIIRLANVYANKESYVIGENVTRGIENTLTCNISVGCLTMQHFVDGEWGNASLSLYTIGLLLPGEKWEPEIPWEITEQTEHGEYRVKGDYGIGDDNYSGYAYFNITEKIVTISIVAPEMVTEDSNFTATVNIANVKNFDSANFDISFNSTVLNVTGVTDGEINNTVIPVDMWDFVDNNTIRVIVNVPGTSGVTGSGYLAKIHFDVIGERNDASHITPFNGTISDNQAQEIDAVWYGCMVNITVIPGDANNDGKVNAVDITYIELIIMGGLDPTPGADANQDGKINAIDITKTELVIMGQGLSFSPPLESIDNVYVNITAPMEVINGRDFDVMVNISYVEKFDAANFDISFDSSIINVTDVINGEIDGVIIPVDMWNFIDSNTVRMVINVPGTSGVTGSGYLAKIHFHALSSGNSNIAPFNGVLSNSQAQEIPAEWNGCSVSSIKYRDVFVDNDYNSSTSGWGVDHFSNIQDGIDAVNESGTVYVYNGTYYENVIVNKTITLTGEDRDATIIDGGGNRDVIYVTSNWVNISGFTIINSGHDRNDAGIELFFSHYNTIQNNNISYNQNGMIFLQSGRNTILGNSFFLDGLFIYSTYQNIVSDNTVNGKNLVYLEEESEMIIDDAGQVILVNCDNITIENQELTKTSVGIELINTSASIIANNISLNNYYGIYCRSNDYYWAYNGNSCNNVTICNNVISSNHYGIFLYNKSNKTTIYGNKISDNEIGIYPHSSSNNIISDNNLSSNDYSIFLKDACNSTILSNNISNNNYGIYLHYNVSNNTISSNNISNNNFGVILRSSDNNTVLENHILNNNYGIDLWSSNNETIIDNIISQNNYGIYFYHSNDNNTVACNTVLDNNYGIYFYFQYTPSVDNLIYRNNFINNIQNAYDEYDNAWDNGYPSGGNYWDDFDEPSEGAWDNNSDGIVDTPYNISGGNNQDRYPLMNPWNATQQPTIIYVDDDADPSWYDATHVKTIQEGIDNASAGNSIRIYAGTYTENIDVNKANLAIIGNGTSNTTVIAYDSNDNAFYITSYNITLSKFTITGATGGGCYGVYLFGADNCTITQINSYNNLDGFYLFYSFNCNLINNTCSNNNGWGIVLDYSWQNTLVGNICNNNNYSGIRLCQVSCNNIIKDNICNNNNNSGIRLWVSSCNNNTVSGNFFENNHYCGIFIWGSSDNLIYNNYFNNSQNVYIEGSSTGNIWNISKKLGLNIIGGPYLGGNYWSDYTGTDSDGDGIGDTSLPYNNSGNIQDGGDYLPLVPLVPVPSIVYVDDDYTSSTLGWQYDHFNKVQDGVDAVDRNGTVYVYNGTYPESVVVTKTIRLTGNGSATIIDGMGQFGVMIAANNTKVSSINVTNCSGSPMQDDPLIGILIGNPSGPDNFPSPVYNVTLENTVFTNNLLPLMVVGYNHTINNNSFYNGSIYLIYTSNTTLQNNSFYGAENAIGIILIPVSNADFHHNVSISNQVNGHPVYYYEDETYISVPKDAGEVITVGCNNFSIENMTYSLLVETLGTSKSVIANNTCSLLMAGCNGNDVRDNMVPKSFLFDGVWGFLIGGNSTRNNIIRNDFSCPGVSLALMNSSKYNNITDNMFEGQDPVFLNYSQAITLWDSSYNKICSNNIENYSWGVSLHNSFNNEILNNIVLNNNKDVKSDGINLYKSDNNLVKNNQISKSKDAGIQIGFSENNTLEGNSISNNEWCGISLLNHTQNNDVRNNVIYSNDAEGIRIEDFSDNNTIYNNFFNNTNNVYDEGNNTWNISKTSGTNIVGGPYIGGNYWSDYHGSDNDEDCIGDTQLPYNSSGNIQNGGDQLPLVYDKICPRITNVKAYPQNQEGEGWVNITCNVTDNVAVDTVKVNITGPDGDLPLNVTMSEGSFFYNDSYQVNGTYNFSIWTIDINGNVNTSSCYHFWLCKQINEIPVNENGTISQMNMDVNITLNISSPTNMTFIEYAENPYPEDAPNNALNKYIDVEVENETAINWPMNITIYYTQSDLDNASVTEDQLLGLYFWNETKGEWQLYNDTGVNTSYNQHGYEGYCWAEARHLTPLAIGGDSQPPSKVTGLTVSDAKDGKLDLSWDSAVDNVAIDHYKIYCDGSFSINVTKTSYQNSGLNNGQTYTYEVSAVDTSGNEGEKSDSETGKPTKSSSGSSSPPPPPPSNQNPVADAGGPYQGFAGEEISFDGSNSYDPDDDNITSYIWDFGDGTNGTGEITTHVYPSPGTYTVTLTVTDENDAEDTYETKAIISQPNNPPSKPSINGPTTGTVNTEYDYTAVSTDPDNDTIKYSIIWGDQTSSITESAFMLSGTAFSANHTWIAAGKYTINMKASDNQTESGTSSYTVYIDAIQTGDIGYLVDTDSDGIYDSFHNETSGHETSVEYKDGSYLIDDNGDGKWDYTYSKEVGLNLYQEKQEKKGTPGFEFITVIISMILVISYVRRRKRI